MKTLKLSKSEVDISEEKMTWGQREIVRHTLMDLLKETITPESMLASRIKRIEYAIKEIREDGKKVGFTKEWMTSLSIEDGDTLIGAINEVDLKKNTQSDETK